MVYSEAWGKLIHENKEVENLVTLSLSTNLVSWLDTVCSLLGKAVLGKAVLLYVYM